MTIIELKAAISSRKDRSAWDRGVSEYALELLDNLDCKLLSDDVPANLREKLLAGARDWREYSEGGCALICDMDIAERLCCPSELRRVRFGDRAPNPRETWLDVQARALRQAAAIIIHTAR